MTKKLLLLFSASVISSQAGALSDFPVGNMTWRWSQLPAAYFNNVVTPGYLAPALPLISGSALDPSSQIRCDSVGGGLPPASSPTTPAPGRCQGPKDRAQQCRPLAVGQATSFNECDDVGTRAGLNTGTYALRRDSENSYTAYINLTAGAGERDMLERVNGCVAELEGAINSGGRRLNLRLYQASDAADLGPENIPNPIALQVVPSFANRSQAAHSGAEGALKLTDGASCATITHELMHVLGLCDEYHEPQETRLAGAYGACRATHTGNSIMGGALAMESAHAQATGVSCQLMGSLRQPNSAAQRILATENPHFRALITRPNLGASAQLAIQAAEGFEAHASIYACSVTNTATYDLPASLANDTAIPSDWAVGPVPSGAGQPLRYNSLSFHPAFASNVVGQQVSCGCDGPADRTTQVTDEARAACLAFLHTNQVRIHAELARIMERSTVCNSDFTTGESSGDGSIELSERRGELLLPAQFARVLRGSCTGDEGGAPVDEVVQRYNECAQYATSAGDAQCDNIPAHCRGEGFLGSLTVQE